MENIDQYDTLKLENQLCFPLYAAAKEVIRQYRPYLSQINLTYTQYIAMMVFWEEKKISSKKLGEKLYLDSGTLTPVLKSLESKGFVRRYRSKEDERVLLVEITPTGEALRDQALSIPQKLASCIQMEATDAQELYRLLYQIVNRMRELSS